MLIYMIYFNTGPVLVPWRMGMSWSRYSWVIAFCAGGGIAEGATTTAVEGAAAAAVVGPISGA